jgi:hypothetical protein
MSNHVSATSNVAATPAPANRAAARKSTGDGASFAEVHAAAVRSAKDEDAKAKATTTEAAKSTAKVKGEKTEKVDGHQYLEIVAGPRNGMFINMSDNSRNGQAFVMVKREGREFHVYGTGDDRAVFEVRREAQKSKSTTGSSTSGSTPATT